MEIIIPHVNWLPVLPVVLMTVSALLVLILGAFFRSSRPYLHWLVLTALTAVFVLWILYFRQPLTAFSDMVTIDDLTYASGIIILLGFSLIILSLSASVDLVKAAEIYTVLLIALLGMMVMIMTRHLLLMYLGLEILSIAIYILSGMNRTRPKTLEAAFKYFYLGVFSSAFLLFGISFLYGSTGSMHLDAIRLFFDQHQTQYMPLSLIGMMLMFAGLAFKIALIPFHMWSPDVYEGNPAPVTGFIATIPKIPVFLVFYRLFAVSGSALHVYWADIFYAVILITVIGGNLLALIQTDIKRMMAYSSVAHAGYISLMIISAPVIGTEKTSSALLFYLLIYSVMTLIVFIILFSGETVVGKNVQIKHLNGFNQKNPLFSFFLSLALFSLAGIPLTGGFMAKWQIFALSLGAGYFLLTVLAILSVLVSVFYYLNLVVRMYFFSESEDTVKIEQISTRDIIVLVICSFVILITGVTPSLFELI